MLARVTEKPTRSTITSRSILITIRAIIIGWSNDFLEDVLDVKEVVNEERSLQARDSFLSQGGGVTTVGAFHHLPLWGLLCHWIQALLTEDMEAVK